MSLRPPVRVFLRLVSAALVLAAIVMLVAQVAGTSSSLASDRPCTAEVADLARAVCEVTAKRANPLRPDITSVIAPFFPVGEYVDLGERRLHEAGFTISRIVHMGNAISFATKKVHKNFLGYDE